MPAEASGFRGGPVLSTVFTGTLSEREGVPIERIPTAGRLLDWLAVNELTVRACSEDHAQRARAVREAIHALFSAAADAQPFPAAALDLVNRAAAGGQSAPHLDAAGHREWRLASGTVEDALSVIADDAIGVLAGDRGGRLARCASPTCRAVFVDTSQSRTRRWCDMNTCGNRQKKARLRARSATT